MSVIVGRYCRPTTLSSRRRLDFPRNRRRNRPRSCVASKVALCGYNAPAAIFDGSRFRRRERRYGCQNGKHARAGTLRDDSFHSRSCDESSRPSRCWREICQIAHRSISEQDVDAPSIISTLNACLYIYFTSASGECSTEIHRNP